MKEGANVPVYVLEFLLGQYCSSDDEEVVEEGVNNVKRILADNVVRPDESQKILSQLRKKGSHTIIDMVTVHLDMNKNCFFADFSNLGVGGVPIDDAYPEKYDRLLCGGTGMEPDGFTYREKWLLLTRMIPLVENNFNLCELGPRSTGKSHLYKKISPNSILVSGGQTTVANLFYNMSKRTVW